MASAQLSLSSSSSSSLIDTKNLPPPRQSSSTTFSSQCVTVSSSLPSPPSSATACFKKIARNVIAMTTTREAPAEVVPETETELPDFIKTAQGVWEKVEDKYAVTSLAVAAVIALWGSAGLVSAIDRLPLVPGVLELVGIGYTGWFAYKNLIFKPERQALIQKIKSTYSEVISIDSTVE